MTSALRQGRSKSLSGCQLLGKSSGETVDAQRIHCLSNATTTFHTAHPLCLERVANILEHGQTRPKPEVLEHHADAAINGRDRLDHPVSKIDLAVIECLETSQEPCQRRLARPGRTEYVRHLSRPELQRGTINRGDHTMSLDQSIKNHANHRDNRSFRVLGLSNRPCPPFSMGGRTRNGIRMNMKRVQGQLFIIRGAGGRSARVPNRSRTL